MTATVVLIGPMGAGKSSVGRRVARLLGVEHRDTDAMVVAEHGPIADIFAGQGESSFRELERAAVVRALEGGGVVSLGGGAVLHPRTQTELEGERVVLLTVSREAVEPRLAGGGRPLVTGGLDDWARILGERRPVYERLASLVIDTSSRPFDGIAGEVADWVRSRS